MEENKNTLLKSTMTYGAIMGLALVVASLIMYLTNQINNTTLSNTLTFLIIVAGIVIASKIYRDNYLKGYITYGQSLGCGVLTGLFASIILAFYTFILYKFIDPTLMDQIMNIAREKILESRPDISDEQLEAALSMSRKFTSPPMMFIMTIIGTTMWAFVISLLVSIFIKKKDDSFDSNFQQNA
ncbi:MAG: DUF4199 domain-containing protein [Bacteroidales bacterium]|nr:DUF4199 domain-containing protein [Bacteroidales bacterium]